MGMSNFELDRDCKCSHARKWHGGDERDGACHSGVRACAQGCKAFEAKHPPLDSLPPDEQLRIARDNHLWLNAFACINPTPEFLASIGRTIVDKLNTSEYRDGLGISKMIILTVNKS